MEELKRRLEFKNTAIQLQAVEKLVQAVLSSLHDSLPISALSPQSSELSLLWESCTSDDVVVSSAGCDAVTDLVKRSQLDFQYALNSLLNLVPTAKCLCGVVGAIFRLLVLQKDALLQQPAHYSCPYAIRDPPHPLITLVMNRPDVWQLLHQELDTLLRSLADASTLAMVEPFIVFLFLEPKQSSEPQGMRQRTWSSLVDCVRSRQSQPMREHVLSFMVKLFGAMQLDAPSGSYEVSCAISLLLQAISSLAPATGSPSPAGPCADVVRCAVELCASLSQRDADITGLLTQLTLLADSLPQLLYCDVVLLHMISILSITSVANITALLKLVKKVLILRKSPWNRLVLCSTVYPLLQIATLPTRVSSTATARALAASVLQHISEAIEDVGAHTEANVARGEINFGLCMTPGGYVVTALYEVLTLLSRDEASHGELLERTTCSLSCLVTVPPHLTLLAAALFIATNTDTHARHALHLLTAIAEKDHTQAPCILPLLLYKLKLTSDPDMTLCVLQTLPKTVTHKMAISGTLKSLQVFTSSIQLKPVALTLMTSLWQQQERSFPYLQEALLKKDSLAVNTSNDIELNIAKAACIRDICKYSAVRHGADMLQPLSDILNEASRDNEAVVRSLAVEGLYYLCQQEVVDIVTTWASIRTKLIHDERTLVLSAMCNFLSLAEALQVDSLSYQEFCRDAVGLLWRYTNTGDPVVRVSAYKALSQFSTDHFRLDHLPCEVVRDVVEAASAQALVEGSDDRSITQQKPPGICYLRLLANSSPDSRTGVEVFLTSVLGEEISNIPRGILHLSTGSTSTSKSSRLVNDIPEKLHAEYVKNKHPGLKSALAASMLMCYNPTITTGRDGVTRKSHVLQHGRSYHQMLYTLLGDVALPHHDVYQGFVMAHGWRAFVNRCFTACMQSRLAELELLLDKGQVDDLAENTLLQQTAWLWTRDKLTDLIRSVAKGSPQAHANALVALSSLAIATCSFGNSLDPASTKESTKLTEHLGQPMWLNIVTDTIYSTLDNKYQPSTRILNLGQQRGAHGPPSHIAQASACIAISQLIPVLITSNADLVFSVLDSLMVRLPGVKAPSHLPHSPIQQQYHAMGLGLVLAHLHNERFIDVVGEQGEAAVMKAGLTLEHSCFSDATNREGSYMGMAGYLSALCADGRHEARQHVASLQQQLSAAMEMADATEGCFQALCLCNAVVAGAGFVSNVFSQDVVDQVVTKLYMLHTAHPQVSGVALALATLCQCLHSANHPSAVDLIDALMSSWTAGLDDQEAAADIKLTYIKGLAGMCGVSRLLLPPVETPVMGHKVSQAMRILLGQVSCGGQSVELCGTAAWMTGLLHMSLGSSNQCRATVPMNYHYLATSSLLRVAVDQLLQAAKSAGYTDEMVAETMSLLRILVSCSSHCLPPLNWASLLAPLMRFHTDDGELEQLCLTLGLSQAGSSPSASLFLASWLNTPLFESLQLSSRIFLLRNLARVVSTLSDNKLKDFLDRCLLAVFVTADRASERDASLSGLLDALKQPDPVHYVSMLLQNAVQTLYAHTPSANLPAISQCLLHLPSTIASQIIKNDLATPASYLKGLYSCGILIANGNQPLSCISDVIEAYLVRSHSDQQRATWLMGSVFLACRTSDTCSAATRVQWMLHLMGFIKNLALGVTSLKVAEASTPQALEFLMTVFAMAVISWEPSGIVSILSLPDFSHTNIMDSNILQNTWHLPSLLMTLLVPALGRLLSKDPWKQLTPHVMDWLLTLSSAPFWQGSSSPFELLMKGCLYGLRHSNEFKQVSVWSKVLAL